MARTPKPWFRKDRDAWFVTIDGTRHNLGPDRKPAMRKFHQLMSRASQSRPVGPETVVAVIDAYLEWARTNRAIRTYEWYLQRCQWFVETIRPEMLVAELRPVDVQHWIDAHPHWSDGHRRGCIVAIQRPFRWALQMGLIETNPVAFIEKPQQGRRDRVITPDEYSAILARTSDDAFRDLLITAWETGARPQELLRVEARHVDPENSRWVFPVKESKGRRAQRVVYLTAAAERITTERSRLFPDGPIFRNSQGDAWVVSSVNCRFERMKKWLGTKYCLYLFRHSFATRMLQNGVDPVTVSVLMGHRDTTMLGRVYQHLSQNPDHLLERLEHGTNG